VQGQESDDTNQSGISVAATQNVESDGVVHCGNLKRDRSELVEMNKENPEREREKMHKKHLVGENLERENPTANGVPTNDSSRLSSLTIVASSTDRSTKSVAISLKMPLASLPWQQNSTTEFPQSTVNKYRDVPSPIEL